MSNWLTPKNLVVLGGVILSFTLPSLFMTEEYEEYVIDPDDMGDDEVIEETTTVVETEEKE